MYSMNLVTPRSSIKVQDISTWLSPGYKTRQMSLISLLHREFNLPSSSPYDWCPMRELGIAHSAFPVRILCDRPLLYICPNLACAQKKKEG